ncbi:MAG TPA: hypothetical protein VK190_03420 [Pseudoneobacillus sp.]|nr:hypothetical protein [Pseudoneobacillus sp.]
MQDKVLISESCIQNEIGYMDLTVKVVGNDFVVTAENHDGYKWTTKCKVEEIINKMLK